METLRALRKAKGVTLKELGRHVGVAESTMSQYENGKREPGFETLLKIAEYFDTSVDYLLTGKTQKEIPIGSLDGGNKEILSKNLRKYLSLSGKDREDVCRELNLEYSTFTDWINGNKYPRIDKIELLANYFGIRKSDLIEEKPPAEAGGGIKEAIFDVVSQLPEAQQREVLDFAKYKVQTHESQKE